MEKGYIKFQRARKNPDKRAYLYVLTPAGVKAKSQLTYRFLRYTLDFYTKMEDKLQGCLIEMTTCGVKRVMLYGANDVVRILLGIKDMHTPEIVGVVDENYNGSICHGIPVYKEHQFADVAWDCVMITALDDVNAAESRLLELGVAPEAIQKLS
jgi:hypothetical protein